MRGIIVVSFAAVIVVREHIPNYCDGCTPRTASADNQDALLDTPWIAWYRQGEMVARNHEVRMKPFHRFSLSDGMLMAEFDEGRSWWVVGSVREGSDRLSLPTWKKHPDSQAGIDAWNSGNTSYDDGRFQHWPLVTAPASTR